MPNDVLVENNPFTFLFANVGVQMLLGVCMVILALYKRDSVMIVLLMPVTASILVCIASPTWCHFGFRYALPIICMNPFLLMLGINRNKVRGREELAGCEFMI